MENFLAIAQPIRRSTGAQETVYLSTRTYKSHAADSPANQVFKPFLAFGPSIDVSVLSGGDPGPRAIPKFGSAPIDNLPLRRDGEVQSDADLLFEDTSDWLFEDGTDWELEGGALLSQPSFPIDGRNDYLLTDYWWTGAPIDVLRGDDLEALSTYELRYRGCVAKEPEGTTNSRGRGGRIALTLEDLSVLLDEPLQETRWKGFGSAVRGTSLANQSGLGQIGQHIFMGWPDTQALTVEVRFRYSVSTGGILICQKNSQFARGWSVEVESDGSVNGLMFTSTGVPQAKVVSATGLNDGEWHRASLVISRGQDRMTLYIDGALVDEDDISAEGPMEGDADYDDSSLWVGRYNNGTSNALDIDIDDIRIYRDARSPTEISDSWNAVADVGESALIAYWTFNQSYLQVAYNVAEGTPFNNDKSDYIRFESGDFYSGTADAGLSIETSQAVTVEATVYIRDLGSDSAPRILEVEDQYRLYVVTSNKSLRFSIWDGGAWVVATAGADSIEVDRELDISVAWSKASGLVRFYVNDTVTNVALTATPVAIGSSVWIGGKSGDTWGTLLMTEARVWSEKLSQSESDTWRYRRLIAQLPDLLDVWPLSADGSSVSGNNDLSATGTPTADSKHLPLRDQVIIVGTGDGPPELAGKPVDICYGDAPAIKPTLEDPVKFVYRVHDAAVLSIDVFEGGLAETYAGDVGSAGDVWDAVVEDASHQIGGTVSTSIGSDALTGSGSTFLLDLYPGLKLTVGPAGEVVLVKSVTDNTNAVLAKDATANASGVAGYRWQPMPGYYTTDLSTGRFRLGSQPLLPISANVRGDTVTNISGVYSANVAVLIASVVTRQSSLSVSNVDTSADGLGDVAGPTVTGLKADLRRVLFGFHYGPDDDPTKIDALNHLVGENTLIYWGWSRTGLVTGRWLAGTATASAIDSAKVLDLRLPTQSAPVSQIEASYAEREVVLSEGDIAAQILTFPDIVKQLTAERAVLSFPETATSDAIEPRILKVSAPSVSDLNRSRQITLVSGIWEAWRLGRRLYEYDISDPAEIGEIGDLKTLVGAYGLSDQLPEGRVVSWSDSPQQSRRAPVYRMTVWGKLPTADLGEP